MYVVQWCTRTGDLAERRFRFLGDARAEAKCLKQHYDGVRIIREADGQEMQS